MGRIVVTEFVSLDGVMEDPGGSENFAQGGGASRSAAETRATSSSSTKRSRPRPCCWGRVTYEGFAEAWPSRDGEFADKFNSMPKYVVSSTLDKPEWNNSTVLKGDVVEPVCRTHQSALRSTRRMRSIRCRRICVRRCRT